MQTCQLVKIKVGLRSHWPDKTVPRLSGLFGLDLSAITLFIATQMNQTKGENEALWYKQTKYSRSVNNLAHK